MAGLGFDCKKSKPFSYQKSVSAFLHIQMTERSRVMEALWFVLGFAVTTTVVLATEKLIIKN